MSNYQANARDQKRAESIRRQYVSREENKMEQLQKLGLCAAQDPDTGSAPFGVYAVRGLQPAPMQGYPAAAWVDLVTPAGRALKVFSLGTKPGLASGVRIQGAKIVQRSSAGGTYYELQDYLPAA